VQSLNQAAGPLLVTTFTEFEFVNALGLRVFRKEVSDAPAQSSLADFEEDLRNGVFQLVPLPDQLFGRARELSLRTTHRLGTRAADLCCTWRLPLNRAAIHF
jgi:hypothetical protein